MVTKLNRLSFRRIWFLLLIAGFSSFESIASDGDTLRPLPKMNKTFQVRVHIVMDSTGVLSSSPQSILSVFKEVNRIFKPINARFEVCRFDTIRNYNYSKINDEKNLENEIDELKDLHNLPGRINMFYGNELFINKKKVCGVASLGGIRYETGMSLVIVCNDPLTVAHELGHYFGLEHTFNQNGAELADGSNCKTAGDYICDTPADPYNSAEDVSKYMGSGCKYKSKRMDAKGQYYNPDPSNIMSYYGQCDTYKFTRGQFERMVKTYFLKPQAW